jgi:hypothetical protein
MKASDFPEPVAKFKTASMTPERNLKEQHPRQVGPIETCLTDSAESATWTCHHLIVCERKNMEGDKLEYLQRRRSPAVLHRRYSCV